MRSANHHTILYKGHIFGRDQGKHTTPVLCLSNFLLQVRRQFAKHCKQHQVIINDSRRTMTQILHKSHRVHSTTGHNIRPSPLYLVGDCIHETCKTFPDNVGVGFQFVDARRIQAALLFAADVCIERVIDRLARYPSMHQRTMTTQLCFAILISGNIQLNQSPVHVHSTLS